MNPQPRPSRRQQAERVGDAHRIARIHARTVAEIAADARKAAAERAAAAEALRPPTAP